ncbi:hemerythrin domain-containing protein [Pedobacter gandavensis]|uniref:hemerythrin domain-containing protein n=1 Tax=Pedobacter gandavensis TaxID=2679963 RepID=UPI002479115B|nr:hemerythrin domain-containing protein [Pedobacter gandavensis]WGQ09694.1 hemerythrin domain-containing protein [Pedobacter gandavensis]
MEASLPLKKQNDIPMKKQPIKRTEEMKLLSRDHHFGLLFSWKIKQGIAKNIPTIRLKNYLNFFWSRHLKNHFLDEEVLLFNRFDVEEPCVRAKKDHEQIVNLIDGVNAATEGDYVVYERLVIVLNDHIRFEERVVFPHLEMVLTESTLSSIGHFLEKQHHEFIDDYQDEFWK